MQIWPPQLDYKKILLFYSISNKKETKVKKDKLNINTDVLINDFKELKSFRGVGLKYQISDNGIRRYSKKIGVYDKIRQYITPRKK